MARSNVRWAPLVVAVGVGAFVMGPVASARAQLVEPTRTPDESKTSATAPADPASPPGDDETRIDETSLASAGPAAQAVKPVEEGFCTECLLIGAGVGITILGIPFIAISEIARNQKESLAAWVKLQGEDADLGFAPGYGFAKADDLEDRYLVAGLVVTGAGIATLLTTVIVIATQSPGGANRLFLDHELEVLPSASPEHVGLRAQGRF